MSAMSTSTSYEVVEEPLSVLRDDVLHLLNATRRHTVESSRFEWLYAGNPDGPAVIWALRRGEAREAVGFTACLPRRMRVDNRDVLCWIGADFSILPKYRTLGLASRLRRAAREAIDAGRADFLYAHPNERMAVVHKRVGHRPVGTMVRVASLLRTAPFVQERLKSPLAGRLAGLTVDPLRHVAQSLRGRGPYQMAHINPAEFDNRFSELFDEHSSQYKVIGVRDAAYLQWRYVDNPLYASRVITASRDGRLAGHLVYTVREDTAHIKDVFPGHVPEITSALLSELARSGYREGLRSASFTALNTNPALATFLQCGYRLREEVSQMYAYAPEASAELAQVYDDQSWYITVGDRDV